MGEYQTRIRQNVVLPSVQCIYPSNPGGIPGNYFFDSNAVLTKDSVYSFRSGHTQESELIKLKTSQDLYDYLKLNESAVRVAAEYDTGHTFDSIQNKVVIPKTQETVTWGGGNYPNGAMYRGPVVPRPRGFDFSKGQLTFDPYWDDSVLHGYGRKAIEKTIPTAPEANLAQAVLELKDGLPSMVLHNLTKMKGRAAREIGGEYLNLTFGWTPLIKDVESLCKAVINFNKIIDQYSRDSGQIVRRRYNFKDEYKIHNQYSGSDNAIDLLGVETLNWENTYVKRLFEGNRPAMSNSFTQSSKRRITFAGAFTYYLSEGSDFLSKMERYEELANQILGIRLTPALLWELTPFSWLVDWWFDIGTFINSVSAFSKDSLVMRYGYLMCETTLISNQSIDRIDLYDRTVSGYVSQFRTIRKQRLKATPYGFGISLDSLNENQWAILAALGLTKSPGSLR